MVQRLAVTFAGDGAGTGELSWGQCELWGHFQRQRTWMPLHMVRTLPPSTSIEAVAAELRFMMNRYHTRRTRVQAGPDGPRQVVAGAGEIPLEIYDTGEAGVGADELADRVRYQYKITDYDFASEWPVRRAVIRHRGVLTHQVTVVCHLVLDAAGARFMNGELATRAAGGTPATAPGMPPLAQAHWQQSAAGRQHCQRMLKHWEGQLRAIPTRRFAAPEPTRPRYWQAAFRSPALYLALRAIAASAGLNTAPILLACYAIALARVTGTRPVVIRVLVSNRFRPGLARTVSPISQLGLLVVEVAGRTFSDVLGQVRRRMLATYKHAYYHPGQLVGLLEQFERERGEAIDLGCEFNDRRLDQEPGGPVPAAAQVRAAVGESSFVWQHKQDELPYEPLFVHVENVPDTMALTVNGDTRYISPADMEACLREIEAVAVAAASDSASRVDA